jgi:hypothetical protein
MKASKSRKRGDLDTKQNIQSRIRGKKKKERDRETERQGE